MYGVQDVETVKELLKVVKQRVMLVCRGLHKCHPRSSPPYAHQVSWKKFLGEVEGIPPFSIHKPIDGRSSWALRLSPTKKITPPSNMECNEDGT